MEPPSLRPMRPRMRRVCPSCRRRAMFLGASPRIRWRALQLAEHRWWRGAVRGTTPRWLPTVRGPLSVPIELVTSPLNLSVTSPGAAGLAPGQQCSRSWRRWTVTMRLPATPRHIRILFRVEFASETYLSTDPSQPTAIQRAQELLKIVVVDGHRHSSLSDPGDTLCQRCPPSGPIGRYGAGRGRVRGSPPLREDQRL